MTTLYPRSANPITIYKEDDSMKLCALLFSAVSLSAATTVNIVAAGPWQLCQTTNIPALCAGYTPGNESYMMLVSSDSSATVAYRYTVTGILSSTGAAVTLSGTVQRTDPTTSSTVVALSLGGIVSEWTSVVVEELVVVSVVKPRLR